MLWIKADNRRFYYGTTLVERRLSGDHIFQPSISQWLKVDSWCVTDGVRKEKERLTAASIFFISSLLSFEAAFAF